MVSSGLFQIAQRFTALIMALYLFNFSIDSRDAHPDAIAEDLSYNDIESVLEFSLECLMGIHNAVAEHDEHDQDGGGSFDFNKIFYCPSRIEISQLVVIRAITLANAPPNLSISSVIEINSPPPRA